MKNGVKILSMAVVGVASLMAGNARAALSVNLLGDTGTLRVETYAPPAITSVTLTDPYGAPPNTLTIVPVTNGFSLTFTPTSDFLATANSSSGGQTTTMDGKLDLTVTLATAGHLTTNIYENGIWATSGTGTVNATGGVVVQEADDVVSKETHGNFFGTGQPGAVYNASGTWNLFDQVTGFSGSFTTYHISIDNTLIAEALAPGAGSAFLAKKDFQIIFTTDGSSGTPNTPEPASLGVLALGGVALLARRRK